MAYKQKSPKSVAEGGTGESSSSAYAIITGGTTSAGTFQNVSGLGTSGQILASNGSSALPSWQANTPSGLGTYAFKYQLGGSNRDISGQFYYGADATMIEIFDNTGGAFFPGTGSGSGMANAATFTAPVSSLYCFCVSVSFDTFTTAPTYIQVGVKGSEFFQGNISGYGTGSSVKTSPTIANSVSVYLALGDIAYFWINNVGGSSRLITGNTIYASGFNMY